MSSSFLITLVEAKPLMAAVVAGSVASFGLGFSTVESVAFASTAAFGVSLGDTLLTAAGVGSKVESYLAPAAQFLDPMDFAGGAIGTMILNYALGRSGQNLAVLAAIGAVAGGVAPKVSGFIVSKLPANSGEYDPATAPKVVYNPEDYQTSYSRNYNHIVPAKDENVMGSSAGAKHSGIFIGSKL